ncbi:hypothetical protein ACSTKD_00005, partial [Vibrio parahaemolyticus]
QPTSRMRDINNTARCGISEPIIVWFDSRKEAAAIELELKYRFEGNRIGEWYDNGMYIKLNTWINTHAKSR